MRALVTGATGFLGSHLVRKLLESGHDIRVLMRETSDDSALAGLDVEKLLGDVCDPESLDAATQGVDVVFNAAGLVAYSRAARDAMTRVNVQGASNVVACCERHGVERLVHVSSVMAVGAGLDRRTLLNEDSPYTLGPFHLGYAETKREGERLVMHAASQGRLDAVVVNPSTIYGAGDARKYSRNSQLKVARGRLLFYTSGGVSVIAVEDVVEGIARACEVGRNGNRYILAGKNLTIRNLFGLIASEAGVAPPRFRVPTPLIRAFGYAGDAFEHFNARTSFNSEAALAATMFHWFDASKARRELGIKPRPAHQAIAASVAWIREAGLLHSTGRLPL